MTKAVMLLGYSFTIEGLQITYLLKGERRQRTFICDPRHTCELFKELAWIDEADQDSNSEPVILVAIVSDKGKTVRDFTTWCDFLRTFLFTESHAEKLAEYIELKRLQRSIIEKVNEQLIEESIC